MGNRVWRRIGVYEHDRLTTLQFFEDRLQCSIAQIHSVGVREQYKSIEPEGVTCVRQLLKRRVDRREREARKARKAVRLCLHEFGSEFVAPARQRGGSRVIT